MWSVVLERVHVSSKEQKIISSRKKSPAACTVLIFFFKPYARKWYQD
jgi:hypothetical protein